MRFKARKIDFLNEPKKVVLRKNKWASALTAISNCLLLNSRFSLDGLDSHDVNEAQSSYLETCISRIVLDYFANTLLPTEENKIILQAYFDITKKLSTGIELSLVAG